MKQVVDRVVAQLPAGMAVINEVDVSTDAALERTYGHEIPVLMIEGRKAAKYRITESELKRRLAGRRKGVGRLPTPFLT